MTITQYWVGPRKRMGKEDFGPWEECEYEEAKRFAQEKGLCVLAYEFELSDSYIVDDFTEGDPVFGRQDACCLCGHDVEWHGRGIGWRDRGNGDTCLPFTQRGEVIQPPEGQKHEVWP